MSPVTHRFDDAAMGAPNRGGSTLETLAIGLGTAVLVAAVWTSFVLVSEPTTILDLAESATSGVRQVQLLAAWVEQLWSLVRTWLA